MTDTTFDSIASQLDYPMIVVTAAHEGAVGGCLVGFHTQCSIDPPRYAVWISKVNHTARVALEAETFALHFLANDDTGRSLAQLFGSVTDDRGDKFGQCEWHTGADGVPLLAACPIRVVARREAMLDSGCDHICFVLAPLESTMPQPLTPLMFSSVRDLEAGHEVS